jgi:hypothetical protein
LNLIFFLEGRGREDRERGEGGTREVGSQACGWRYFSGNSNRCFRRDKLVSILFSYMFFSFIIFLGGKKEEDRGRREEEGGAREVGYSCLRVICPVLLF